MTTIILCVVCFALGVLSGVCWSKHINNETHTLLNKVDAQHKDALAKLLDAQSMLDRAARMREEALTYTAMARMVRP